MWLTRAISLLFLPTFAIGCMIPKRTKGTSNEQGISIKDREYRRNKEFIREFNKPRPSGQKTPIPEIGLITPFGEIAQ